jgi:glycosyltransferase involved in cell wall biosynthesis
VPSPGYGSAVGAGVAAARGQYIVVGDADGSYDFLEIPRFVDKLREGYDLVQGCRLPAGGGTVTPGAMPFLHLRLGNPMFSGLARRLFGTTVSDIHCGLKGFTRALYQDLDLRSAGFEFNCELLIEATSAGRGSPSYPSRCIATAVGRIRLISVRFGTGCVTCGSFCGTISAEFLLTLRLIAVCLRGGEPCVAAGRFCFSLQRLGQRRECTA